MPLTLAQMHALFNDNTAGDISAADGRDVIEALYDWALNVAPLEGAPTYSDAGMSDEFDSGTLDAQWTVSGAVSGSVSMISTNPTDSVYDLTTLPGTMLVMVKPGDAVAFRVDDFIASGEQVIVCLGMSFPGDATQQGNSMHIGVGFNDDDSAKAAGNDVQMIWDGADDARLFVADSDFGNLIGNIPNYAGVGRRVYLRMARDSNTVHYWHSLDGIPWSSLGSATTHVSSANNFWVFMGSTGNTPAHANIVAVHWVRHVANTNYLPW